MRAKTRQRAALVLAAMLTALVVGGGAAQAGEDRSDGPGPLAISAAISPPPKQGLVDAKLRRRLQEVQRQREAGVLASSQHPLADVEVTTGLPTSAVTGAIASLGGTVTGAVPGVLVQARVPVERLADLERLDGLRSVRAPIQVHVPPDPVAPRTPRSSPGAVGVVGEEVAKTNASRWHAAGITGAGVKVGIVDYFRGESWRRAQVAGEVPPPAGTICRVFGASCDVWKRSEHGVAVAEVIHEMAPKAQLYLGTAATASDLRAVVDYFVAQGVRIVSRSLTSPYDGPGDGTGPTDSVVAYAISRGITWFNSAGNAAGSAEFPGGYWRGTVSGQDGAGWVSFAPGRELLRVSCTDFFSLRWSDWAAGSGVSDYDVYDYDPVSRQFQVVSNDDQTRGAPPVENFSLYNNTCSRQGETRYLAIKVNNPGRGTKGDVLELLSDGGQLELWQNRYSAATPVSDVAIPGAVSVGAIDPATGTKIGYYSSQGPTNDERIKPDLSAAACLATFTYGTSQCFNGTSAATPVAAGAAALVLGAKLASTPGDLSAFLTHRAVVHRGASWPDNSYGAGELVLGVPPRGATPSAGGGGAASQ